MDQDAKETACRIAAQHGVCLFTRGREVYRVGADGHEMLVCRSQNPMFIWTRALQTLSLWDVDLPPTVPKYRLQTWRATYESNWLVGLLLRLMLGLPSSKIPHAQIPL